MKSVTPCAAHRLADAPGVRVALAQAGLACCALEVDTAIRVGLLVREPEGSAAPVVTVLVVSGTVTDVLAPAVVAAHAELADAAGGAAPLAVLAFGACASTGGPYWDAPTVTKGIDELIPVSVYVPGCPPRPEALVDALRLAAESVLEASP